MAGILTEQDEHALHHLAQLLPPHPQIAKDVSLGEASEYVGAALTEEAAPEGNTTRRRTGRMRRALEQASNTQTLIWGIPSALALGFIFYLAGNDALQTIVSIENYQAADTALRKINYTLNIFQDVDLFKQQIHLLNVEAQELVNAIKHGALTAVETVGGTITAKISAKLRPKRRLALA